MTGFTLTPAIAPLGPADAASFAALHAIYVAVIERSEQKTEASLRANYSDPRYRFLAAREAGALIGFASLFLPPEEDFWLLEYLAVSPAAEGRGVGGALFRASAELAGEARPGLVEVDLDLGDQNTGEEKSAERRRRIGFYARAGCRRLGSAVYQLPLRTHGVPPPMQILVAAPAWLVSLARVKIRRWLTRIYADVYGEAADDPRIAEMLAGQPDDIPLTPL